MLTIGNINKSLTQQWSKLFTAGRLTHDMRSRNRYPRAIIDLLVTHYGFKPGLVGADLGSGTGRLSALFLEHGYNIVAIENDEHKRAVTNRLRDRWEQLEVCPGTPVASGLGGHSVDFVVSQRGIYWPDQAALRREVRRILRPGGPVAFVTDSRVYSGATQTEAYEDILRTYCTEFREKREAYDITGAVKRFFEGGEVYEDAFVGQHTLTIDALINETRALPICPPPGSDNYHPIIRALHDYFNKYAVDDVLVVPTVCRVACGRFFQ